MKLFSSKITTRSTMFLALSLVLLSLTTEPAYAQINLDAKLSCSLIESSDKVLPVGSVTKFNHTLRQISQNGMIKLDHGQIFLYSNLKAYNAFARDSGMLVLATDPALPKEVHGSITVTESEVGKLVLDVTMIHTTRAFEVDSGNFAFIYKGHVGIYKLACDVQ